MCSTDPVMVACSFAPLGYAHSSSKANVSLVTALQLQADHVGTGKMQGQIFKKASMLHDSHFPLTAMLSVDFLSWLVERYSICTICNN